MKFFVFPRGSWKIMKKFTYHNGEIKNSNIRKKFTQHVPFFLFCLTTEKLQIWTISNLWHDFYSSQVDHDHERAIKIITYKSRTGGYHWDNKRLSHFLKLLERRLEVFLFIYPVIFVMNILGIGLNILMTSDKLIRKIYRQVLIFS